MAKIEIPEKDKIYTTGISDPVRFYYHFILKYPFLRRLRMILNLLNRQGASVLDVGYGSGIFFWELEKRFNNLYGIDLHDKQEAVRELLRKENIIAELKQADITSIPYGDNTFDCVLSVSTLEHVADLRGALKEMSRILKDGGEAVFGFPSDNPMMQMLHYVFDRTPHGELHVSGSKKIIGQIRDVFDIEEILTYPFFLPPGWALYAGCRCVKKRQTK